MDKTIKNRLRAVINTFENDSTSEKTDYSSIYLYGDGPGNRRQVTLGFGITEYGNMKALLQDYVAAGGQFANDFKQYIPNMGNTKVAGLASDKTFIGLLVKASKQDQKFRDAEDKIFEDKYFAPMLQFADKYGFKENLSLMVLLDSFIQSGQILPFLRSRFSEATPKEGGDEKTWIKQYVDARHDWLANHSRKVLRNTTYRTEMFQREIKKENWNFNLPLVANGTKISV